MLKLGRSRPLARCPRLSLGNYFFKRLPTAPREVDYSIKPAAILGDILGNDSQGDCTIAAAFHIIGGWLANATESPTQKGDFGLNAANALAVYHQLTGGPDTGLNEQDVLNCWQQTGFVGHKSVGWAAVDATDIEECKSAIWLFENLYFGVEMPAAWINPFPSASGFLWQVAGPAVPANGHAFCSMAYSDVGPKIETWGMDGWLAWNAVSEYCSTPLQGELYTVLSEESIIKATAKAPSGVDWDYLLADFQAFTS
jgi:hypothetical protein